MLHFLDERLMPAMEPFGYHNPVPPLDLIYGISGCHSSFVKRFRDIAAETGVDLYRLIVETSVIDKKAPSEDLIRKVAARLSFSAF